MGENKRQKGGVFDKRRKPREFLYRVFFVLISLLLFSLAFVVASNIFIFFRNLDLNQAISDIKALSINFGTLVKTSLLSFLVVWLFLYIAAREFTIVSLSLAESNWFQRLVTYLVKLLSVIPTVLMGNAFLLLAAKINFLPKDEFQSVVFVVVGLVLVGLPTILKLTNDLLYGIREIIQPQVTGAMGLGATILQTHRHITFDIVKRSFTTIVVFGLSRVFVEGYLVVLNSAIPVPRLFGVGPKDLFSIFSKIYSTVTIESNIVLVILLFFIAITLNIFSATTYLAR